MSETQAKDDGALAIGRRTRKSLEKIDDQLVALRMRPISGPVEERIAVAAVRQAGTDGVLLLVQVTLTAFGVIVAISAMPGELGFLGIYITAAVAVYVSLTPMIQARRGRRVAVRAVLDHRINRTAAVHAASSGGDHKAKGRG